LFWVIDGNSPFLHQLNAGGVPKDIDAQDSVSSATTLGTPRVERLHSPLIELDETTTGPDYLRFFCASIWGQEGPFMLVEGLDSPLLVGIDIDDQPWLDEIKPLQMTRDLPGFWRGSWRDVVRDMKGRYPKHRWPDEPWAEDPSLKTKNAFESSRRT
jgi:hypothetical protein